MSDLSPMMIQYLGIKEQYRDAVLFFRLGDFYEMFNEDAVEVSRLLNLTLTHRGGNPMCGIPYHASRVYIARLLRSGKRIAICEQTSVPGSGKGLVERSVVEVITPGTATEEDYLEQKSSNYLASICFVSSASSPSFAFAYIDVSTGEFAATSFPENEYDEHIRKELGRIQPRELLIQQSLLTTHESFRRILDEYPQMVINRYPDWSFNTDAAYKRLCKVFSVSSLAAFALEVHSAEIPAAALLIEYLTMTAGSAIAHITGIKIYGESEFVSLDDSTRKNLELVHNLRDGTSSYTLFETLDHTCTAMGGRLLRNWIHHPLTDIHRISERHAAVSAFYRSQKQLALVDDCLAGILDLERLAGRIAMERAHGRDLVALKQSLFSFIKLTEIIQGILELDISIQMDDLESVRKIATMIDTAVLDDCTVSLSEGGIIRAGWSAELDGLRSLRDNSTAVLESYIEDERQNTGIQNLKIRYNRMIGYYLEVTKGNLDSVPSHFIRRRSLANGDRYTTDRLVELETELNNVHARIIDCEQQLFLELRKNIFAQVSLLSRIAREIARLDVLHSFARAATLYAWNRPEFSSDGFLDIREGRHPVVEMHVPSGEFIPNSIRLASRSGSTVPSFALITGPNMSGKSTFLRQTALIVLMAQIGSFVPAGSAVIDPVDRIFCRVGASDNLARGESTFLVEMTETAHILRTATKRSLVIMDEVGRGTSTEDGLSIAQAVTEYLLETVGARTLFATHYHELSRLAHPYLADYCLEVLEAEGTVVFLKKVREGASANSYGIHVARLAGVPEPVLERARNILAGLSKTSGNTSGPLIAPPLSQATTVSADPSLFRDEELVLDDILSTDINALTPLEALIRVERWKKQLSGR